MKTTHLLFFRFSCGHEYYDARVSGGVSERENCLCESCQPYDAVVVVNHPCRHCGGSFNYLKDDQQIRLSEEEAQRKLEVCLSLFSKRALTVTA